MTETDEELVKTFDALSWHVTIADAFRSAHKGLLSELQVRTVASVAPTFFRMALAAMYDVAFLSLARLFDVKPGTVRLLHFLEIADRTAGKFKNETPEQVRSIVNECRTKINAVQPLLVPLRERRNKILAHLAKETVADPLSVEKEAATTDADWEKLISVASGTLNAVRVAFDGLMFSGELLDWSDYENLLHVLREGKRKQITDYEEEFGAYPYLEQKRDLGM